MVLVEEPCPAEGCGGQRFNGRCYRCLHAGRQVLEECAECHWLKLVGERCRRCPQIRRQQRRSEVRQPPRPPFERKPGCSLCGHLPLPKGRRSWCGKECVEIWHLATDPRAQLRHLRALFGDTCWVCWDEPGLEVDHVRPLWSLTDDERLELRWWLPFNLQLIGIVCHRDKTAKEAAERATLRRGEREPALFDA